MSINQQSGTAKQRALFVIIIGLLLLLPLLVYLALTQQLIFKEAAFGQATVSIVPAQQTATVGQDIYVEVFIDSGSAPVSAVSVTLTFDASKLLLTQDSVEVNVGATAPFDQEVVQTGTGTVTITGLAKRPTSGLKSGSTKLGGIRFDTANQGQGTVSLNVSRSEIVGFNGTSDTVNLTVIAGTPASYSISGELCRINACVLGPSITLQESTRPDSKYDINLAWTRPSTSQTGLYYKIYRGIGTAVPVNHPDSSFVGTTSELTFSDTNGGVGFNPSQTVYYDIDTYFVCPAAQ